MARLHQAVIALMQRLTGERIVVVFIACGLIVAGPSASAWSQESAAKVATLRLATTNWIPFTGPKDQPRVAVDLVHEALRRMDVKPVSVVVPEGQLNRDLAAGVFDGSPAMWQSADREAFLIFSDPLLENRLVLVGRKGADIDVESLDQLRDKTVGIVGSFAYGQMVSADSSVRFVAGQDDQQNLDRLLGEKVDYILVDELLMQHALRHQLAEIQKYLVVGTVPVVRRTLHFVVRKAIQDGQQLMASFNKQLMHMRADGSYNRILGLDWIHADTDGDGQMEFVLHGDRASPMAPQKAYSIPTLLGTPGPKAGPIRFLVGGEMYDSWDAVPTRYKVLGNDPVRKEQRGVILLEFRF